MRHTAYVNQNVAERLRRAFESRKVTMSRLGEEIGKDRRTISAYINGDRSPDCETLRQLCLSLNVSADWLLFGAVRK